MLPYWRKILRSEDRVEKRDQYKHHTLGKMLEGPARDAVRDRGLADFETPDGMLHLREVGQLVFARGLIKVRSQNHIKYLNHCRVRRVGYRLKLSLNAVGDREGNSPWGDQGLRWSGDSLSPS
jgi:hypothetical protein